MGVLIGINAFGWPAQPPTLPAVLGFVLFAAVTSTFYFGKLAPVFLTMNGVLESHLVRAFPLAGALLGIAVIAASLYGKTLGFLSLEDFYENGKTRLSGLAVAAFLNLLLLLAFSVLAWFLFPVLPNATQLQEILPLQGLGV